MKKLLLITSFLFILVGCSTDETNYITVKGRVEREINGEGISNQKVTVAIKQHHPNGQWSYSTIVDSKEVTTDSNGNFSVSMKNASHTFVSVYKPQDDNYSSFERGFELSEDIVLKVNKFLKFKIYVNNTNPFDSNDQISISFVSGNPQSFRTGIENFGIQNAPNTASWIGTNVNSTVYYNVPENANEHKIVWYKRKNGVDTSGATPEIPFQENQINEYHFEY